MTTNQLAVDFLVIGAGMAGLTAAARAAAAGCSVALVERGPATGGSAAMSGGVLWQPASREALAAIDPLGDPALIDVFFARFPEVLTWVRGLGIEVDEPTPVLIYGLGRLIDVIGYLRACERQVTKAGGWVVTDATVDHLIVDDGAVIGAAVVDRDGSYDVHATTTLLATGGFQGDAETRARYLGANARRMLVRSNPVSDGAGLRLGLEAGAATSRHMDGFYGHLMVSPLEVLREADFVRLSQWYCMQSVVVGKLGHRITDESNGYPVCAQAALQEPQPRVAVLFDEHIHTTLAQAASGARGLEVIDRIAEAERVGGRVAVADSWADLCDSVSGWGFDAKQCLRTIDAYNEAMTTEDGRTDPPRTNYRRPLTQAPFYAVEAQPAITFTMGGLRIDDSTRVLDTRGVPISGLYAAGADSGGTFAHGYGGGLALGSVTGLVAAEQAAARAASPAVLR
ncbi:FAD-dependent oxidoreductase [Jatrophihabitans cynanchi]|uniref:FAD-dependent oxidoreductase n=1 Tax=Jatrophihabitans cynanchi TaxID=2944128 RepID=A0ABY7K421_9ACTN|nr:FAD-dependent oxidoreductase [Jatrophihabitans sp. SB3-54]WAX58372.1 FAD-dependent oxidoreductase [Jatrophihabitans sp. SB3-54]